MAAVVAHGRPNLWLRSSYEAEYVKKITIIFGILASFMVTRAASADVQLPPFLPGYYAPAFDIEGRPLLPVDRASEGGVKRFAYGTVDKSTALVLEKIECDRSSCTPIFRNILGFLNERISGSGGKFHTVSEQEIYGGLHTAERSQFVFVYVLPASVLVWNFVTTNVEALDPDTRFQTIRTLANKHRYQVAQTLGNIAMGAWGPAVHEHARQLLRDGHTREGLAALRNLLATSSFNYEAHIDLIEHTGDPAAARTSAEIVFKNAESRKLIDRAAKVLQKSSANFESIPFLENNLTGLQVVLIPLSPCNPWLLEEAARTFEQIAEIPVKVRRLKELWWFAAPNRVYRQRNIQRALISQRGESIDFADWTRERYASELLKATASEDALSRYQAEELVGRMNVFTGQYRVGPVLNWLSAKLEQYRSDDNRTMYVGITEANIYSGDNNYIFSSGILNGDSPVSVLSYSMMLAETLSEEYESRKRLIERIAKELVPASLKQLRIPRPLDPSDPYSYADGVARLDQKTLVLSESTKDALKTFRTN